MPWSSLSDAEILQLADAIVDVARALGRSVPPPRGMRFFGLDMTLCDAAFLDRYSAQGIFRKYQRALCVGGGLGGTGRWWANRFGCSVLSVDRPAVVAAARRLGGASGTHSESTFQAGAACALPLRDRTFTNAWSAADGAALEEAELVLAEVFRVLRPGGFVAWRVPGSSARDAAPRRWIQLAGAAGFYGLRLEGVATGEIPHAVASAEQRLNQHLAAKLAEPARSRLLAAVEEMRAARRRPSGVLLYGERPA